MTRRHLSALTIALAVIPRALPTAALAEVGQTREPQKPRAVVELSGVVVDVSGRPIARAAVVLTDSGAGRTYGDVTDEEGRFRFSSIEPGRYTIVSWTTGYAPIQYGASFVGQRGTLVTITAGQRPEDLTITLRKGSAISGSVRDEFGDPIGMTVFARDAFGSGISATTDQHGRYRLGNLLPGTYVVGLEPGAGTPVIARDSNGQESTVIIGPAWYGGGSSASSSLPIRLGEEADVTGIDLVARYVPASALTVTISAAGEIVSAPQLEIAGEGQPRMMSERQWENGRYRVGGLPAGRYVLLAAAMVRREGGTNEMLRGRAEVTIDGIAPATINIPVERGAELVGRIVFDGVGTPPRATVSLRSPAAAFMSPASLVRPDGLFSMSGITAGEYVIDVPPIITHETGWMMTSVTLDGQEVVDSPIHLSPGTITSVTVTMSNRPAELTGRVTDAGARPQPGLTLVVYSSDRRHWYRSSRRLRQALPDALGTYRLTGLPPGEYWLAAVSGGLEFPNGLVAGLTDLAAGAIKITLSPGEQKRQDLRTGKTPLP
jgi:protocatechuate 3,4-dioxygenase beta subunit